MKVMRNARGQRNKNLTQSFEWNSDGAAIGKHDNQTGSVPLNSRFSAREPLIGDQFCETGRAVEIPTSGLRSVLTSSKSSNRNDSVLHAAGAGTPVDTVRVNLTRVRLDVILSEFDHLREKVKKLCKEILQPAADDTNSSLSGSSGWNLVVCFCIKCIYK